MEEISIEFLKKFVAGGYSIEFLKVLVAEALSADVLPLLVPPPRPTQQERDVSMAARLKTAERKIIEYGNMLWRVASPEGLFS